MNDLPRGWVEARLRDVADNLDSRRVPVNRTERARRPGTVPYYGATGRVGWIDEPLFDEELVLVGEDGAPFLHRDKEKAYVINGPSWVNNHAHVLRALAQVTLNRYLKHLLDWTDYRPHVNGTTRLKLTKSALNEIPVPLPPLSEQRRIVAAIEEHLSRLDAADASLTAASRRVERMPAVVLSFAVNGSESARLADVAEVRLGRQRSPKNHAGPNMVPYLRAANVTWRGLDLSDVKAMNFAPAEVETYELRDGDVLLSEASGSADEVGKPAIWRGQIPGCCFQNTLIRVRSRGPDPEYLHKVFLRDALMGKFADAAPGVGIHHLGSTRLSEWKIPVPPLSEQRRIVAEVEERLSAIDALRAAIERAQRRSAALRRAVLERAFRGELVPQDLSDEPAEALLARIRAEREARPVSSGRRRKSE